MRIRNFWIALLTLMLLSVCDAVYAESNAVMELPDSLEIIEEEAFFGDTSLEKVIVPKGVKGIGSRAFADSSLTEIELPESLEYIADDAFEGCEGLKVTAPQGSYAYEWAKERFGEAEEEPEASPAEDFEYTVEGGEVIITGYTGNAPDVVIPSSIAGMPVSEIDAYAFYGCNQLKRVSFEGSNTIVGNYAFFYSSVESVELPANVDEWGFSVFGSCSKLTNVEITEGAEELPIGLFSYCTALRQVVLPEGLKRIGSEVFAGCSALTEVEIPESVENIDVYAFMGIEDSVTLYCEPGGYVPIYAYMRNMNLVCTGVSNEIPDGLTYVVTEFDEGNGYTVGIKSYSGNASSLVIPAYINGMPVRNIWHRAFEGCTQLTEITIPSFVVDIGDEAFKDCTNLQTIKFADEIEYPVKVDNYRTVVDENGLNLGEAIFSGSGIKSIKIPGYDNSVNSYAEIFDGCSNLENVTIMEGVTSIGDNEFYGCSSLESVILPNSVVFIGNSAFFGCSRLKSITLSAGIASIGSYAFCDCNSLMSIILPEGVTSIGNWAFSGCGSLTSVTIPDGTVDVGHWAFYNCVNLMDVTIPKGVTILFSDAFAGCSNLTTIYGVPGSYAEEWANEHGYEFIAGTGPAPEVTPEPTATVEPIVTSEPTIAPEPTATPSSSVQWQVSYDTYYSNITVSVASGTPDAPNGYLFLAEEADGLHYPSDSTPNIPAGASSATFSIKNLQMKRAKAYKLFVLPAGVSLTDDNRDEYFIAEVVLPLWESGMINAVRSVSTDVTNTDKLYVGDQIEIDWDGSFGVETTEIAVTLNGTPVEIDPIVDKDGPETIIIDSEAIGAEAGDVLKVTVTVSVSDPDVAAKLTAMGRKAVVTDEWEGTYGERLKVSGAAIIDGENRYDTSNGMQLVVGDHNYQNGYTLEVQSNAPADVVWTVYTDDTNIAKAYRTEDGLVHVNAKATGKISLYISDTYVAEETLDALPEDAYVYEVCDITIRERDYRYYNSIQSMGRFNVTPEVFDKTNITKAIFLNAQENADLKWYGELVFIAAGWGDELKEEKVMATTTFDENTQPQTRFVEKGNQSWYWLYINNEWVSIDEIDGGFDRYLELYNINCANDRVETEYWYSTYGAGHSAIMLIDENENGLIFEVGAESFGFWDTTFGETRLGKNARFVPCEYIQKMLTSRNQVVNLDSDNYKLLGSSEWVLDNSTSAWDNAVVFEIPCDKGLLMFEEIQSIFENNHSYQLATDDCDAYALNVLLAGLEGIERIQVNNCNSFAPNGTYEKLEAYVKGAGAGRYVHSWE